MVAQVQRRVDYEWTRRPFTARMWDKRRRMVIHMLFSGITRAFVSYSGRTLARNSAAETYPNIKDGPSSSLPALHGLARLAIVRGVSLNRLHTACYYSIHMTSCQRRSI